MTIKPNKAFLKRAKKLLKRNPGIRAAYKELYDKLSLDPFDTALHTHALKGKLKGKYACSLSYNLRVIFRLSDGIVYLLDICVHDEVY